MIIPQIEVMKTFIQMINSFILVAEVFLLTYVIGK